MFKDRPSARDRRMRLLNDQVESPPSAQESTNSPHGAYRVGKTDNTGPDSVGDARYHKLLIVKSL